MENKSYGQSISIETRSDDLTVSEVVEQLIRPALLAIGYAEDSVMKYLGDVDFDGLPKHEKEKKG